MNVIVTDRRTSELIFLTQEAGRRYPGAKLCAFTDAGFIPGFAMHVPIHAFFCNYDLGGKGVIKNLDELLAMVRAYAPDIEIYVYTASQREEEEAKLLNVIGLRR